MAKRNHKKIKPTIPLHKKQLRIGGHEFEAGKLSELGDKKLGSITKTDKIEFLKEYFNFASGGLRSTAKTKLERAEGKGKQDKVEKWRNIAGYYDNVDEDIKFIRDGNLPCDKIPCDSKSPEECTL